MQCYGRCGELRTGMLRSGLDGFGRRGKECWVLERYGGEMYGSVCCVVLWQ